MLGSLMIRNLALIDELNIEFAPGLNVVTGETGAGKSIVIGALQLILGQRADKSLIRAGASSCQISAILELAHCPSVLAAVDGLLGEAGAAPCEDGQLLVRRVIGASSGRCFANSTPVTLQALRQIGDLLVDVHGPYDHQSLLHAGKQLEVLDAYAGLEDERDKCRALHRAVIEIEAKIAASEQESLTPDHLELLRFQVNEIAEAELRPDEEEVLTARHRVAANSQEVLEAVARCTERLSTGDDAILEQTAALMREFYELESIDSRQAQQFVATLERAVSELQALHDELGEYAETIEIDGPELTRMDERLALLLRLKRKYGGAIDKVLAFKQETEDKLWRLEHFESHLAELRAERARRRAELLEQARQLSRQRRAHARRLAPLVARRLKKLGFAQSKFKIDLQQGEPGPGGMDTAQFDFAPNPGEGSKPLRAIASSGEIARVMLALKAVLAAADQVPILVFDEVDANVAGTVANTVGAELASLAAKRQVICITHLPQVAAGAERHFLVAKKTSRRRTLTSMTALDEKERAPELARMLGGADSSSVVLKHAEELLARARQARS